MRERKVLMSSQDIIQSREAARELRNCILFPFAITGNSWFTTDVPFEWFAFHAMTSTAGILQAISS
jgi:hypothetical protein